MLESPSGPILMVGKAVVERIKGLRIEIYVNEHAPPHFHVNTSDTNATFTLNECKHLKGDISSRNHKLIKHWYHKQGSKKALINIWDKTRPTNCVVGKFIEEDSD